MRQYYRILNITHNGTKGERGVTVTEEKYDGVIGCQVSFNPDNIRIGYGLTMIFAPYAHRDYEWWSLSNIQNVYHEEEDNILVIETTNSIYYLECLGEK